MTTASIAANVNETLDVQGLPAPQISFDLIVAFYLSSQGGDISII
jgi:hypothetical protein